MLLGEGRIIVTPQTLLYTKKQMETIKGHIFFDLLPLPNYINYNMHDAIKRLTNAVVKRIL
jgi:hypothetical protein